MSSGEISAANAAPASDAAIRDRYWRAALCRGIVGSRGDLWERSANGSKSHQAGPRSRVWISGRALYRAQERRGPRGGQDLGNRGHEAHPRRTECALRATAPACEWLSTLDGRSVYGGAQRSRAPAARRPAVDLALQSPMRSGEPRSRVPFAITRHRRRSGEVCPPAGGSSDSLSHRYAPSLGRVDRRCRRRENLGRRQDGSRRYRAAG